MVLVDPQGHKHSVTPNVVKRSEELWQVEYTALHDGLHTVNVLFAGKPIPHSPFSVGVSPGEQLVVVCCLLSIICCLLSVVVVCCLLSVVCCLLSVVCCLLSVVCCLLSVVCCCCLLSVVCCLLLLSVVCCLLSVVVVCCLCCCCSSLWRCFLVYASN